MTRSTDSARPVRVAVAGCVRDDGWGGCGWCPAGGVGEGVVVVDDHDVAGPASDPTGQLWVVATLGRLAGQGLLERRTDSTDPVAVAGQRLLIAAGLLNADPFGPSERLRSLLPAGAPLASIHGFVR